MRNDISRVVAAVICLLGIFANGFSVLPHATRTRRRQGVTSFCVGHRQSTRQRQQQAKQQQQQQQQKLLSPTTTILTGHQLDDANAESSSSSSSLLLVRALTQPTTPAVSLPAGVLLVLMLLPFLVSKIQALLTFTLFGGFTYVTRSSWKSKQEESSPKKKKKNETAATNQNNDTPPPASWDHALSLGFAMAAASWLTPTPQHHHHVQHAAASHGGGLGFLPVVGLLTVLFLAPKIINLPFLENKLLTKDTDATEKSREKSPQTVETDNDDDLLDTIYLHNRVHQRLFNSWDEKMDSRQTPVERSQMKSFSVVRDASLLGPFFSNDGALVCRDCFVPPGALGIVLHSTAQGPVVYSVKETSRLHSHVAPGDVVIAVDDVETKNSGAEEVMHMLMARRGSSRKITVVSFNSVDASP